MKLGQGSHRRMPVACWSLAILAAALVLPGAAGGLAQSPAAQEQVKHFADTYQPADHDLHVQQASHEVGIEDRASNRTTSPSVAKIYALADLLDKMKRENNWTDDVTDEQVKQALVNHLRCFSLSRRPPPLDLALPSPQPSLDEQTRCAWSGNQLVVSGPEAVHKRLVKEIEFRRKHSFGQVTIEVRIMQGSPDLCAQDAADSAATPEDGSAFWKNRWILFQHDFATAEPTSILQQDTSNGLPSSTQAEPIKRPSASITTGKSDPVVYQFLDDELFRAFLNYGQGDERNTIILAPKVTLFDGQTAEISDCSQKPFATDITKVVGDHGVAYQPVIQVFWEGTKIRLAPAITPEGHRLNCQFKFAAIDDCKTFRPSRYPDANDIRVQHPVVTTASLECAIDIPTGQTLLIGGLFPRRVERTEKQSAISQLLGRQPTKIDSEEMTYIAITPRTITPRTVSAEK